MAANTTNSTPNPSDEDQRADLHAMLAASRELGPEMDRSLVDSYLERQRGATGAPRAVAPSQGQPGQPQPFSQPANLAAMGLLTVAYVVALIVSTGGLWWVIFPLMGVFGGWLGVWGHDERHEERHAAHDEYRLRRREMRYEYRARRHGYALPADDRREDRQSETAHDQRPATPTNTYD
jgi:hypothetical protein